MSRNVYAGEPRGLRLPGVLLIVSAIFLGIILSAVVLLLEQDRRAVQRGAVAPAAVGRTEAVVPAVAAAIPTSPASTALPTAPAPTALPAPAVATVAVAAPAAAPAVPTSAPTAAPAAVTASPKPVTTAVPTAPVAVEARPASGAPAAAGSVSAATGKTAFAGLCGGCHPNGNAGFGPAIKGLAGEAITGAVRQGKGAMPAYAAGQLSDQQLLDIVAFLQAD